MRHILFSLIILLSLTLLNSCNKSFLDLSPTNSISERDVWNDVVLMHNYVYDLYNRIESGISLTCDDTGGPLAVITDEARSGFFSASSNSTINPGLYSTSNAPLNDWNLQYASIRNQNLFLDKVNTSPIAAAEKEKMVGEVKFLRALSYFELVKRFGAVPLITNVQDVRDDLMVPRSTLLECYNFIESDLDEAIGKLPETAPGGLASKWSAYALKSRVMLYAASYAQFGLMDSEGYTAIPLTEAETFWQKAYDAAIEVINSGKFTLVSDLSKLFLPKGPTPLSESIFEIQYAPPLKSHSFFFVNAPNTENTVWTSITNPSQQLVDAFPMRNGLPITDQASGYDPQDPYTSRDARLDASVFRNGSPWRNIATREPTVIDTKPGGANGIVGPDVPQWTTHTGYFVKKFIDPEVTLATREAGSDINWIELRLAEVILNMAEAAVELDKLPEAVEAIKKLRDRVGTLVPFTEAIGKSNLREIVRNERKIELCFENHRFWDLRRWRKAEEVLNGLIVKGIWITDIGNGNLKYEVKPAEINASTPRVFLPKHNFFPIPLGEMQRNNKLVQNPGWN